MGTHMRGNQAADLAFANRAGEFHEIAIRPVDSHGPPGRIEKPMSTRCSGPLSVDAHDPRGSDSRSGREVRACGNLGS